MLFKTDETIQLLRSGKRNSAKSVPPNNGHTPESYLTKERDFRRCVGASFVANHLVPPAGFEPAHTV